MISRKAYCGGMPTKAKSKKQSKKKCSKKPDPENQNVLHKILENLCVDDIEKNPKYMGIWEDIMAEYDDSCLGKLSRMSNKQLEKYGISKDEYQFNQTVNDATRFRKACQDAL
jgi:hypothetical protein